VALLDIKTSLLRMRELEAFFATDQIALTHGRRAMDLTTEDSSLVLFLETEKVQSPS